MCELPWHLEAVIREVCVEVCELPRQMKAAIREVCGCLAWLLLTF